MIVIVTICFLSVSILLSTFLGFSPNFYKLTEGDFLRRINSNTIIYGLQFGDVALRAKTLANPGNTTMSRSMGYIKKKNGRELDDMNCDLALSTDGKVSVAIKYKPQK